MDISLLYNPFYGYAVGSHDADEIGTNRQPTEVHTRLGDGHDAAATHIHQLDFMQSLCLDIQHIGHRVGIQPHGILACCLFYPQMGTRPFHSVGAAVAVGIPHGHQSLAVAVLDRVADIAVGAAAFVPHGIDIARGLGATSMSTESLVPCSRRAVP